MPKLRFPDGDVWDVQEGSPAYDVVRRLSEKLLKSAVCVRIGGVLKDLSAPIETVSDEPVEFYVVTEKDKEALDVLRHSASHIMAAAVMRIFGKENVKLAIGPSIEEGFYYDFDLSAAGGLSVERLPEIEEKMKEIVAEDSPFVAERMKKSDAYNLFKELKQTYKLELLDEMEDEEVTVYRSGEFVDLCRGPHMGSTGRVEHFKLLSVAGAYWRGDEKREMLVRVYGTAFFKKEELEQYLKKIEEAKWRDHRVLGKRLDYFSFHPDIGAGLVLWHPKGALVRHIIE
ncbi:MAG: threonine--tRNA ligase, partial [Planctomycetota bacterium]|nr:threonine--tRNA ligase [Planctomycetota bacterium]